MRLAIAIPCWNKVFFTQKTVESLYQTTEDFSLILVDDGSTDETWQYANELQERFGTERFIYHQNDGNRGVNYSWNRGVEIALARRFKYLCIANNDLLFTPGWVEPLIKALQDDEKLAVVSPMSTYGRIPDDWPAGSTRNYNPAGYMGYMPILGACFMCRTLLFREIGSFPEEMKVYWGDNWIVLASQAKGYECGYARDSYIHHLFCQTTAGLNNGEIWEKDTPAFEKIAESYGIKMRPYLLRNGQRAEDLPVTGVK